MEDWGMFEHGARLKIHDFSPRRENFGKIVGTEMCGSTTEAPSSIKSTKCQPTYCLRADTVRRGRILRKFAVNL